MVEVDRRGRDGGRRDLHRKAGGLTEVERRLAALGVSRCGVKDNKTGIIQILLRPFLPTGGKGYLGDGAVAGRVVDVELGRDLAHSINKCQRANLGRVEADQGLGLGL